MIGNMSQPRTETKIDTKNESKEINFDTESVDDLTTPHMYDDKDGKESWVSKPSVNLDRSDMDDMRGEISVKADKIEINIDPSKTLSLKTKTMARKKEEGEGGKKVKKPTEKKDTVKVNDLIINKDLINSSRF